MDLTVLLTVLESQERAAPREAREVDPPREERATV